MSCFYPIKAYRVADKLGRDFGIVFAATAGMNVVRELSLPCGSCIGCKMEKARQWAVRCVHEAKCYERNSFVTLTYNTEHLPDGGSLDYTDFQKFMKRLRKHINRHTKLRKKYQGPTMPYQKIKYFVCGEYGENGSRPHFHACIFNYDPDDRVYLKTSPSGSKIYTSKTLERIWSDRNDNPIGFVTVGDVDFASAAYVARYVIKKQNGRGSEKAYQFIDPETGEVHQRDKELVRMSNRKGIGHAFYEKYKSDIFPNDICVIEGKEMKPPKYYYKKLAESGDVCYDDIQYNREMKSRQYAHDNSPERLAVKEKVLKARLTFLKREVI